MFWNRASSLFYSLLQTGSLTDFAWYISPYSQRKFLFPFFLLFLFIPLFLFLYSSFFIFFSFHILLTRNFQTLFFSFLLIFIFPYNEKRRKKTKYLTQILKLKNFIICTILNFFLSFFLHTCKKIWNICRNSSKFSDCRKNESSTRVNY